MERVVRAAFFRNDRRLDVLALIPAVFGEPQRGRMDHHTRVDAKIADVHCFGLNKVARHGNLVAFEMVPGAQPWRVLGESVSYY